MSVFSTCAIFHIIFVVISHCIPFNDVNLPDEHWPFYFRNNQTATSICKKDDQCKHKKFLNTNVCWGYENDCTPSVRYSNPNCSDDALGWVQSKFEQFEKFYNEGDFGYILEQKNELKTVCKQRKPSDGYLSCTNYTRFCKGANIMIDFSRLLTLVEPVKYKDDILGPGLIGSHCDLNTELLHSFSGHKSPLQSWYAELEHFTELPSDPFKSNKCDVTITRPSVLMKLDAPINMFHHFCDFVNLYNTMHLNGSFSRDVNIILWDTLNYYGNFGVTWKAFTKHPIMTLRQWRGKKVCFRDVVFPLLPRMIFGMYYNMPLVPGCSQSGLFHAFSRHILHNLNIPLALPIQNKVRITLLSRKAAHRNIINEDQILEALKKVPFYIVQKVVYDRNIPFTQQLQITQQSDIFIGMHGAGLTHLLFLPDWACVFEVYNCQDENCYKDLARLRGVHYLTWQDENKLKPKDQGHHPSLGAHAKFTDYTFDVDEFLRIVKTGAEYVTSHPLYLKLATKSSAKTEL